MLRGALVACGIQALAFLLTGNVLAPIVAHIVLHGELTLRGIEMPPTSHPEPVSSGTGSARGTKVPAPEKELVASRKVRDPAASVGETWRALQRVRLRSRWRRARGGSGSRRNPRSPSSTTRPRRLSSCKPQTSLGDRDGRETDMGKVRTGLSVSLDGFISGPNDGPEAPIGCRRREALGVVLRWRHGIQAAWNRHGLHGLGADRQVPCRDAQNDRGDGVWSKDIRPHQWVGSKHPLDKPDFVVTSSVPQDWVYEGSPSSRSSRTDLESRRRASEGGRRRQGRRGGCREHRAGGVVEAGLLDEIHVDLVHVLLGGGVSLFDHTSGPARSTWRVREGDRGRWCHASYFPRHEVWKCAPIFVVTLRFKLGVVEVPDLDVLGSGLGLEPTTCGLTRSCA